VLWGALAVSVGYLIAGSVLVPQLWQDPLGPLLKIWPIAALNLLLLALFEPRR
jgi:hypothetical protein